MPPKTKRAPVDHEGARESEKPGEPQNREVITPDWVAIENSKAECVPDEPRTNRNRKDAPRKPQGKPPAIDRHR
jgi:hypothetical protein